MVLGIRGLRKGLNIGYFDNTQLQTQAAAVSAVAYSSSGAINMTDTVITVAGTSQAFTLGLPVPGKLMVIADVAGGTVTVTTQAGTTFDGTNNTATMNATADIIVILGISSTRWLILYNISTVLSDV